MQAYAQVLRAIDLEMHPIMPFEYRAEAGSSTKYYSIKSKGPFVWRNADLNERDVSPWISFLGCHIRFDGDTRIRKESIEKHKRSLGQETAKAHGMTYFNLAAKFKNKIAEPLFVEATYSEENQNKDIELTSHDGQELDIVIDGKLKLPENMWYIGTINNDDSTFAVSDKVYDRAIPIDLNSKGKFFEAPYTENLTLSYKHLEDMFRDCQTKHKVSEENLKKIEELDDYVIEHFRLAFGNRIVKQLKEFVPAYVGCGGTEIDGIDFVLAKKVFRKFESLNLSLIRDEIKGLINYLNTLFGKGRMVTCIEFLERLQRTY